jgi:hypothetical protein
MVAMYLRTLIHLHGVEGFDEAKPLTPGMVIQYSGDDHTSTC